MGITVIRFTNEEIYNDINNVIEKIKKHLPHPLASLQKGE